MKTRPCAALDERPNLALDARILISITETGDRGRGLNHRRRPCKPAERAAPKGSVMTTDDAFWAELGDWRRDFHAHPEFGFEEHRTSRLVAERLRSFGLTEVAEGVGGTGVVATLTRGAATVPSPCGPTWTRSGSPSRASGGTGRDPGRHARLRPRRAHHHAARCGEDPRRRGRLRRHGAPGVSTGRGVGQGSACHAGRWAGGAFPVR